MPTSGDNLNTGPGGFPIDGQTYTYDVGVPDAQGGSQGPHKATIDVSAGFIDADGKPKDLSAPTKATLGQYLSKATQGKEGSSTVTNKYPVDAVIRTLTLSDGKGFPVQLENPVNNANSFTGGDTTAIAATTTSYPSISSLIKKGKSSTPGIDGNDLLSGVPGTVNYTSQPGKLSGNGSANPQPIVGHKKTDQVVNSYVSTVLSTNRFASAGTNNQAPYTTTDVNTPDPAYQPALTRQHKLGAYDPLAPTVTTGRLASIGPLLTMRAGLELNSTAPGADPNSDSLQAGALLPGLAQLGATRVDQRLLLASDILATLTDNEVPNSDVLSIGAQSWGQLNNVDDPFSGTDALGMTALSTALVAGLVLIIDGLSLLIGAITPGTRAPTRDNRGRYAVGEYFAGTKAGNKAAGGSLLGAISAVSSLNLGALVGIQPTNFPLNLALQTGTNAFFGLPQGGNVATQLLGTIKSSADSPGFNVVIARAIIRGSVTIADALGRIGGNVMNDITAILSLIDSIRSSKVIAAINVFSILGDAILSQPADFVDGSSAGGNKTSEMDSYDNTLTNAASKSRLKGSLKLAWASNTAPANVLLPASILGASAAVKGLGQFSPYLGVQVDSYSRVQATVVTKDNGGRIDPATAAAFETELDAEYVPFYFHDVRTNEMVSFHAFLASLTDDFAAGFEKSEGFGRVEPVRIYKSTERRIGMSFYIAATSLNDFDEMWVKINKLVTLVYPQYTQGLTMMSADQSYSVTQPFSQLVGASPLIRIRLGDLLRSNYSQFALARLFGLGNQDFKVNGSSFVGDSLFDQSQLDLLSLAVAQAKQFPNGETYVPADGSYPLFADTGNILGRLAASLPIPKIPGVSTGQGPSYAPTFQPQKIAVAGTIIMVKALAPVPGSPDMLICEVAYNDDPRIRETFAQQLARADAAFNNDDLPLQKVIGGKYVIPAYVLRPTDATMGNFVSAISGGDLNTTFATDLTDFLNPNDSATGYNAVAKSFKDTGGKGLAGFIETMAFDWLNQTTWETNLGSTAPKLCKVTIGFAPIHDISPGIDHLGFNRAPIFPVSSMGQQNQTKAQ